MIVGIVGLGAMGTLFAQSLETAADVRRYGRGDDAQALQGADYLIVAVKSYTTVDALRPLQHVLRTDTPIVSIQNGIDQIEQIDAALPHRPPVVLAPTTHGAVRLGSGRAELRGAGLTTLGWAHGRGSGDLASLRDALIVGGLAARIAQPIEPWAWAKLVANAAINPVTALAQVRNGAILERPELRARAARLARESANVAAAASVTLPFADAVAYVEAIARATATNRSSMLVDVEHGRPTEIESLNGAVVRRGALLGVETPENQRALDEVRARTKA